MPLTAGMLYPLFNASILSNCILALKANACNLLFNMSSKDQQESKKQLLRYCEQHEKWGPMVAGIISAVKVRLRPDSHVQLLPIQGAQYNEH